MPKFRLSPYKMYGAYWSNAEQKVRVPIEFQLGNPGSALPGMSSACCIDIPTCHHGPQNFHTNCRLLQVNFILKFIY